MKNSIIDNILYANNGVEDGVHERVTKNEECKAASDKSYEAYKQLEKTLSGEQWKLVNEFVDLRSEEKCVCNEQYFKEGVKTGMRLAVECFYDDIS